MAKNEVEQPLGPFLLIWSSQAVSLLGSSLVSFALIWWLTESTGSGTILAVATIVTIMPRLVLSPIIGTLVDRWPRRLIMLGADSLTALATLLLALLFSLNIQSIYLVYVLMFVRGLGTAFHGPAMIASTSLMVAEKHFSRVAGLNNALRGAMSILAPLAGALLVELLPLHLILAVDVLSALPAIGTLLFVVVPQPAKVDPSATASILTELKEGVKYITSWRGLMLLIGVYAMVHFLLAPATALMPLLVTDYFGGGALQLAWMQSATGVGLVAGGLFLGVWGGFERRMATAMVALAFMGLGMILIGLVPPAWFGLAVAGMFLIGFTLSFVTSLRLAVLQAVVPPAIQGRVITMVLSATALTDPFGLALAGPLSDSVGVRTWYLLGGLITVVVAVGALYAPAIMAIEDQVVPAPAGEEML